MSSYGGIDHYPLAAKEATKPRPMIMDAAIAAGAVGVLVCVNLVFRGKTKRFLDSTILLSALATIVVRVYCRIHKLGTNPFPRTCLD
jgi:hypothetical protein